MSPTVAKLNKEVHDLQEELKMIKSFVFGNLIRTDEEGEYNPKFVKEVLEASQEEGGYVFTDKESFLKEIRKHD